MLISSEQLNEIKTALQVATIGGIESIIIEDGFLRGVNDSKSFAIISDNKIPNFPQKIGVTRLSTLLKRLGLFTQDTSVNAKETDRGEISMLEFSSGRNKMQFRCTSSMLIKAPKSINDTAKFALVLSTDEASTLVNSVRVMGSKKILLIIDANKQARFEVKDESNDMFKFDLSNPIVADTDVSSCIFSYPSDMIVSVFSKLDKEAPVIVGEMGTIKTFISSHEVTILPTVNEDSGD